LIGIVAFIVQLQLLHLLRYHKTISILGTTLASAMWTHMSMHKTISILGTTLASAMWTLMSMHKTISILGTTLASAMWTLMSMHKTTSILGTTLASAMWTLTSMSERRQKSREMKNVFSHVDISWSAYDNTVSICSQRHVGSHQLRLRHEHRILGFHHSHLPPLPRSRRQTVAVLCGREGNRGS